MKNLQNILKGPLWLFELVTSAKSFTDNPVIGSTILNRMGLHVARLVVSHAIMHVRMWMLALPVSAEDRKAYFRDGFIMKENFLSAEDFQALEKETRYFKGEVREARQGDTLTHRAVMPPEVLEDLPAIKQLIFDPQLGKLARFTAGHARMPLYYLEEVKNKYCEGHQDPQKTLHSDTFHPTMKCWFFIDDVTLENGPFNYVPGSHKLTWKYLKWHYRMSLSAKNATKVMHKKGSFRFTENDLKELGLPEPHAFTVKNNTLLIANTFGIHRRGDSLKKSTRLALWGDSRTNPFIPFPGIGGQVANQLQYYFLALYRRSADQSAAKRGVRSPWRVIETEEK